MMPVFVDQLGRQVLLERIPERIVSIVPSQTEYLYDLGLGEKIVGQTLFCIHPKTRFANATKVGGTKRLHIEKIRELKPDIIVANKEENEENQILELAAEFPVWISDIKTMDDALEMMLELGIIFNCMAKALQITDRIRKDFSTRTVLPTDSKKALYFIWFEPWMAAGRDTFIHEMLLAFGFENAIADAKSRYPELDETTIMKMKPDLVLLSSEPFPFKQKHIEKCKMLLPDSRIVLVDGEMFSWYGSRLLYAKNYMQDLKKSLV